MNGCRKMSRTKLIILLLTFSLICDLTIDLCHCQDKIIPLTSIACLPTDDECELEQQKIKELDPGPKQSRQIIDYGYQSDLEIPLPKPGEDLGEDIMIVDQFDGPGQAGQWCDTVTDCSFGLLCISFHNKTERQTIKTIHDGRKVCGNVYEGKCSNPTFECLSDSSFQEYEFDGHCFSTCQCLPPNDSCQYRSAADCPEHSVFHEPTPGNCCPECIEPGPTKLNETIVIEAGKNIETNCNVSSSSGNRTLAHGSIWMTPSNDVRFPCMECRCQSGFQICNNTFKTQCPTGQECTPHDQHPTDSLMGTCCPPCKSCFDKRTHHNHGTTWQPEDSDCQTCSCNNSKIICQTFSCQPLECSENEIKLKLEKQCCPICVCNLNCSFGKVLDKNGNETCSCLEKDADSTETFNTDGELPDGYYRVENDSFVKHILLPCTVAVLLTGLLFLAGFLLSLWCCPESVSHNRTPPADIIRSRELAVNKTLLSQPNRIASN